MGRRLLGFDLEVSAFDVMSYDLQPYLVTRTFGLSARRSDFP